MTLAEKLLNEADADIESLENGPFHKAMIWEYEAGDLPCIHLWSIRVRTDAPPGTGTKFMRELMDIADRKRKWITLDIGSRDDPSIRSSIKLSGYKSTTSSDRLRRWYSSLGFRRNASKGLYQLRGTMHRPPMGKYPW